MNQKPYILNIGGFDPSNGAGVTADLKAFEVLDVYALSVQTCLTVQNESEIRKVYWFTLEQIKEQIDVLADLYQWEYIKISLTNGLKNALEIVNYVSQICDAKIIWDPVMRSSSGYDFYRGVNAEILETILNKVYLATPNWKELEKWDENAKPLSIASRKSRITNIYLKGGHNEKEKGTDYLFLNTGKIEKLEPEGISIFEKHGSGCVFASALTAYLAKGDNLVEASKKAKNYMLKFIDSNDSLLGYHPKSENPKQIKPFNSDNIKNILIDLDGTISDPREGIINGIYYSIKKLGLKSLERSVLEKFIGPPLHQSYESKFGLNEIEAAAAVTVFREYYSKTGWAENKMFEDVPFVLQQLFTQGYRLFVATSKPTFYAEKIIRYFKIDHYFEAIIGSNLDNTRSDKAEIIKFIIDEYGLDVEHTIMLGDTKFDIIGAHKNDIQSVAVLTGTDSIKELETLHPNAIIENAQELLEKLKPKSSASLSITAFTYPDVFEDEAYHINQLFKNGLDELVIRKVNWTDDEVLDLLEAIDETYHQRIFICDRPDIVLLKSLKGLHCSNSFYDTMLKIEQNQIHQKLKERGQKISISVHNPKEWAKRKELFDQLYLCPIFESISKPGYKGNWDHNWIMEEIEDNENKESLIALGGIHSKNLEQVNDMGFDGIGVLGVIWNDIENSIKTLKQLKSKPTTQKPELA